MLFCSIFVFVVVFVVVVVVLVKNLCRLDLLCKLFSV